MIVDATDEAPAVPRPEASPKPANRLRLSVVDVTFALFCLIPPLVFGPQLLNSDGDAARHIRMGELLLRDGLGARDTFSFTQPGDPVVLTEWGSRIAYALVHQFAGLAGVALFAGLLIGTASALVVLFLLRRGVDPLLAYLTGIVTAFGGQVHWLARPHLFTLIGLALLLFLLEPGRERRHVWKFGLLFLVWANLHGGHVLGLIVIGVYLDGAVAEALVNPERRTEMLGLARWYGLGLLFAAGASLLNPQGPMLIVHVFDLLGYEYMTATTFEFRSPDFHTFYGKQFLVLLGGVIAVLSSVRPRPDLRRLALILLMMAGALVSRRNIPLFALLVSPLVALHANAAWKALPFRRLGNVQDTFQEGEAAARPGLWLAPVLAILLLLGLTRGAVAGTQLVPDQFDPKVFPVAAVDWAREHDVSGRVFNLFTWGGFMVYAWPEQPIFIDGMTDYFDRDILDDYLTISGVQTPWAERMEERDIDLVLMPPAAHLVYALELQGGWSEVYADSVAVLLQRHDRAAHDR